MFFGKVSDAPAKCVSLRNCFLSCVPLWLVWDGWKFKRCVYIFQVLLTAFKAECSKSHGMSFHLYLHWELGVFVVYFSLMWDPCHWTCRVSWEHGTCCELFIFVYFPFIQVFYCCCTSFWLLMASVFCQKCQALICIAHKQIHSDTSINWLAQRHCPQCSTSRTWKSFWDMKKLLFASLLWFWRSGLYLFC